MLRQAQDSDHAALGQVMFDAVRTGISPYTQAQREAWVPTPRSGPEWDARLSSQTIVLDEEGGIVRGFMSLAAGGYIDLAFVRPAYQVSGLFRKLFNEIRRCAQEGGEARLWVHASLMAKPAFNAMGFVVLRRETAGMRGQSFERYEMEMRLSVPQ